MWSINTYDIDGVINLGNKFKGLRPDHGDIIITGRSIDEQDYTLKWLASRLIYNPVYFNNVPFAEKTREKSGLHKASVINQLTKNGYAIGIHFEDDPVQANIIREHTNVIVVEIVHDLVEKENVWHGPKHD